MKNLDQVSRAKEVYERKTVSRDWLAKNYYDEWSEVAKAYRCERDPVKDSDGNVDAEATSIATPLTNAHVNRTVARLTAQPPNPRIRTNDPTISEVLSRHNMYCWDTARVQRQQKRHIRQAAMFGWSVRSWYWHVEEYDRHAYVDPLIADPAAQRVNLSKIDDTYGTNLVQIQQQDPERLMFEVRKMLESRGRNGLIKVVYTYAGYAGPKCDFVLIADVYPEPHFESLQKSGYVILERRRDKGYLKNLVAAYPELKDGVNQLFTDHPKGTKPDWQSQIGSGSTLSRNFRSYLARAYDKDQLYAEDSYPASAMHRWTITEEHIPGRNPKLRLIGEDSVWIGEIPYPYDLDGKIALTDCILMDDLLGGIGDSNARFGRGLQQIQDRFFCTRTDMLDMLSRPLVGTTSRELLDDPSQLKRYKGMRLVRMRGPNEMWVQGEQAAIAAAQSSLSGDQSVMQQWQIMTGENNLSMSANVDPQQSRTATGARIMAYTGDVITKDLLDMVTQSSLIPDVEMMFLLCRSEMTEASRFQPGAYARTHQESEFLKSITDQNGWYSIEPQLFQRDDFEIEVEVGSTLADDDEAKIQKAKELYTVATSRPDLFNAQKARDEILLRYGKGKEMQEWVAQPQPPPPPPPPVRPSLTLNLKGEDLIALSQMPELPPLIGTVLHAAGIELPGAPNGQGPMPPGAAPQMPGGPPPPPGPPGPMVGPKGPPPMPPPSPPEPAPAGAGAYAAAKGKPPIGPAGAPSSVQ